MQIHKNYLHIVIVIICRYLWSYADTVKLEAHLFWGKAVSYCGVLPVSRQGFCCFLKHLDDPWKYEDITVFSGQPVRQNSLLVVLIQLHAAGLVEVEKFHLTVCLGLIHGISSEKFLRAVCLIGVMRFQPSKMLYLSLIPAPLFPISSLNFPPLG